MSSLEWKGSSNVLVVVRMRPLSRDERGRKEDEVARVIDGRTIEIRDPGHHANNQMRQARLKTRAYAFDHSFAPSVPTSEVYACTTRFLVAGVMEGYNATVFAYGATGSGKTHTMLGNAASPGLMPSTLRDLWAAVQSYASTRVYTVAMTYVEIYNENVRDLLSDTDEYLDLREDPVKGQCVAGVSEHKVHNTDDILELLLEGNKRRMQEPTAANRESSRSHAVLQIHVRGQDLPKAGAAAAAAAPIARGKVHRGGYREAQAAPAPSTNVRVGKFSLIDLAGSERAANTKNSGLRLVEGANINRSLLALGNCIEALVAGKGSYVPYRDSKLTRLLKDSLGGNCKTVMISCISPAERSFEETCNTLKYANRAKNIRTVISKNESFAPDVAPAKSVANSKFLLQAGEYDGLISGLRVEVETLKLRLSMRGGVPAPAPGGAAHGRLSALGSTFSAALAATGARGAVGAAVAASALAAGGALASPEALANEAFAIAGPGTPSRKYVASAANDPFDAAVERAVARGSPSASPRAPQADLDIPDGFVLVNAAEAAAAAQRLASLREELVLSFQERMQLRRALIELSAQNVDNAAEIERKSAVVAAWEDRREGSAGSAAAARRVVSEIAAAIAANGRVRVDMEARLATAEQGAEAVRAQLDTLCTTEERRELLSLEYRVCLLELEKLELEQSVLTARKHLEARIEEARVARGESSSLSAALRAACDLLRDAGLGARAAALLAGVEDARAATESKLDDFSSVNESRGGGGGGEGKHDDDDDDDNGDDDVDTGADDGSDANGDGGEQERSIDFRGNVPASPPPRLRSPIIVVGAGPAAAPPPAPPSAHSPTRTAPPVGVDILRASSPRSSALASPSRASIGGALMSSPTRAGYSSGVPASPAPPPVPGWGVGGGLASLSSAAAGGGGGLPTPLSPSALGSAVSPRPLSMSMTGGNTPARGRSSWLHKAVAFVRRAATGGPLSPSSSNAAPPSSSSATAALSPSGFNGGTAAVDAARPPATRGYDLSQDTWELAAEKVQSMPTPGKVRGGGISAADAYGPLAATTRIVSPTKQPPAASLVKSAGGEGDGERFAAPHVNRAGKLARSPPAPAAVLAAARVAPGSPEDEPGLLYANAPPAAAGQQPPTFASRLRAPAAHAPLAPPTAREIRLALLSEPLPPTSSSDPAIGEAREHLALLRRKNNAGDADNNPFLKREPRQRRK